MTDDLLQEISRKLARVALEIGALRLNPSEPFTWASGYRMPIYNDNRLLLGAVEYRNLVASGFREVIRLNKVEVDVIAGAATAGIPHAAILANLLELPLIYVRPKPKGHGMKNQVEGPLKIEQKTVVIEDLISTGRSALEVVTAIRSEGAFDAFVKMGCGVYSLLTLPGLLTEAENLKKITSTQSLLLHEWSKDPFGWGEARGFSKE